jgi:recombination protein RecT
MAKANGENLNLNNKSVQSAIKQGEKGVEEKRKTVIDLIQENKPSITEMLPKHVTPDKFIRTVISAIRSNEKLKVCTPVSIMDGVRQAAQLGLEFNTPLQQAYLIPYKRKKKIDGQWTEFYEAQFQYGYRGIVQLVWQAGLVKALDFDKICDGDDIVYEKTHEGVKFSHKPSIKGKRGNPYAYYAAGITKDGGFAVVVMSKEDIVDHALKYSKSKDQENRLTGPWQDDFDSMALKTVIKLLADKKLPKSADRDAIMLMKALAEEEPSETAKQFTSNNNAIIEVDSDYEVNEPNDAQCNQEAEQQQFA